MRDDRTALRIVLVILSVLACQCLAGCDPAPEANRIKSDRMPLAPLAVASVVPWLPAPTVAEVATGTLDIPDRCDRLLVIDTRSGPQFSKVRPDWLRHGPSRWQRQREDREIIAAVVAEMGGSSVVARMIWYKSIYESSGNARNVHIHSQDVDANRRAARKGRTAATERWRFATVPVYERHRRGLRRVGDHDAWSLGRGLYGQVTGLHMRRWSADAPPWSLCDPVIATITVVWSMRAGLAQCHGSTLRDAYRRFSSGKCQDRGPKLEGRFDTLARGHVRKLNLEKFDPDERADLGDDWPEETSDRLALLAAVSERLTPDLRARVDGARLPD